MLSKRRVVILEPEEVVQTRRGFALITWAGGTPIVPRALLALPEAVAPPRLLALFRRKREVAPPRPIPLVSGYQEVPLHAPEGTA